MKKVLGYILSMFLLSIIVPTYAAVDDDSIIAELDKDKIEAINFDFKLKTFESCQDFETIMDKYIKDYYKIYKGRNRYPVMYNMGIEDDVDFADEEVLWDVAESKSMVTADWAWWDFSKTNTQVDWVDESDIIKTDWTHIYYYNQKDKAVYIVSEKDSTNPKVIKKINLPNNFNSPVLYLWNNRLVIIASGYSNTNYSKRWYWVNRQNKTYTIVFDTSDITSPKLLKLYVNDGNLRKSRKIGDYVYLLSSNHFNIPYYNFKSEDDITVNSNNLLPKMLEVSKTSVKSEQNLKVKGKELPYNLSVWNVAKCSDIEYILPDEETLKKFEFNPSYNIISAINIKDTSKKTTTKVVAWSNSEIYMSLNNLYLTENIYQPNNFRCPVWADCIMPFYYGWTNNTLVHKMSINDDEIEYKDSTIIPGQPLNQYSMDEKDTNFRIITSEWRPERSTWLYILDDNLEMISSLTWLAKGESFKSSRFMWDKLYLVTFKQVDPLFAIDLSDVENPEVLWELKIPWYSTYLHPYDSNHLIGLWYDTTENKWWGTMNNWVKVDLYQINYDKKCWDSDLSDEEDAKCDSWDYKWIIVKQLQTLTLWENWSSSEALSNPRMFVWNKAKNTLLLPVTLYKNDSVDTYKRIDFFNWLSVINISKDWIKEKARVTHIDSSWLEEKRQEECAKYTVSDDEPECKELLDWSMYCPPKRDNYVPEYCFKDAPIWSYIASRSWNFRDSFIKRALYIWDDFFSISDDKIITNGFSDLKEKWEVEFK